MKMKNMYVRKFSKNIANWKKSKKQVENSFMIQYDLIYLNIKTNTKANYLCLYNYSNVEGEEWDWRIIESR